MNQQQQEILWDMIAEENAKALTGKNESDDAEYCYHLGREEGIRFALEILGLQAPPEIKWEPEPLDPVQQAEARASVLAARAQQEDQELAARARQEAQELAAERREWNAFMGRPNPDELTLRLTDT